MSFSRYRATDLTIFAVILAVFEFVASRAALSFASQPYSISVTSAVTCIVFMRWGLFGCIHAVLGGFVYCLSSKGSEVQFAVYMVGNLFAAAALLILKVFGSDRVKGSLWLSMLLPVSTALLMQLGRGLVAVVLGSSPGAIADFILTDVLSGVFAVVIVLITRRLDGVFENQKAYLVRVNRREESEEAVEDVYEGQGI